MNSSLELVRQWHEAFEVKNAEVPNIKDPALNDLRLKLLFEELNELAEALSKKDLVEVLDALTDLQFVLDGAYLAFGLSKVKDAAFKEVWNSNMSKLDRDGCPIRREDGKILKGPNFVEPDLKGVLKKGGLL